MLLDVASVLTADWARRQALQSLLLSAATTTAVAPIVFCCRTFFQRHRLMGKL